MGGVNLVNHWERCLNLIKNEKYFILFSDDDVMSNDYIEQLNLAINQFPNDDVFHFRLNICDKDLMVNKEKSLLGVFPDKMSSKEFFLSLYHKKITARMPDFAFKTSSFKGFLNFPLAMRSDNATVIKSASENGIRQIKGELFWRESDINISSNIKDKSKCYELIIADYNYLMWVNQEFGKLLVSKKNIYKRAFINFNGIITGKENRLRAYNYLNINGWDKIYIEICLLTLISKNFIGKIKRYLIHN